MIVLLDGRITLKDFQAHWKIIFHEDLDLLLIFASASNHREQIDELHRQIISSHRTIEKLQAKLTTCEKAQRLSSEIELEYEHLLKFLNEQMSEEKFKEMKRMKEKNEFIDKLLKDFSSNSTR